MKSYTVILVCAAILIAPFAVRANSPEPEVFRLVTLGDSITKGVRQGVTAEETFTTLLGDSLRAAGVNVEVINTGIGGEKTDQALARLDDIIALKPDCVTVMYGTNDAFIDKGKTAPRISLEEYGDNLRAIVLKLQAAGIATILMTEPPLGNMPRLSEEPYRSNGHNFLMIPYMNECRLIADAFDVTLVDNFARWSELALTGHDIDALMTDGVHPNPAGHRIIAETILPVIRRNIPTMPAGYTIPVIDISGMKNHQVVIDREKGQYLGHPTTVLLEDGKTMIIVYPKGHGRGAIVMKRSADGGLTWSDRLPVPGNWSTSLEVPTIYRTIDRQGVRRLVMFSGLYPIRMAVSGDDGATWSPLEAIGDYGGIVAMSDLIRLRDGRYMAFFHDDGRFLTKVSRRTNRFRVFAVESADGGLTWGDPRTVAEHPAAHLCEPGIVRSPDGSRIAMLLRENSRKFNSFVTMSDDEGATWTTPVELPAALTGDRHQGVYAPDGRLVIVFRDTARDSRTWGDFVAWVGTFDDIASGHEGQYRIRLLDNTKGADCGYPGIHTLPDGAIAATTYGHWTEGEQPYIVSVRFRLDDIDRLAEKTNGR